MSEKKAENIFSSQTLFRSYGRVKGRRISDYQQTLMEQLLPSMSITLPEPQGLKLDMQQLRERYEALWLEIGFGGGEHLVSLANAYPQIMCLGAEPFLNGVAKCLVEIDRQQLKNIRLYPGDVQLLLDALPDACLERVDILFPDPWPKTHHHKRRIINPVTLTKLSRVMKPGAVLWLATDHTDYARWMKVQIDQHPDFNWCPNRADVSIPPNDWHQTRYQQKAALQGINPVFFYVLKN